MKTEIAAAVAATTTSVDNLMQVSYVYDYDTSQTDAYVFAASLGNTARTDLGESDSFSVVSIAKLLDVTSGSLAIGNTTQKTTDLS